MPVQMGGPSLPKPKKPKLPKVITPATYNPLAYVPGGSAPQVAKAIQNQGMLGGNLPVIPQASNFVQPNQPSTITGAGTGTAQTSTDPYGDELGSDEMWRLADKNYTDALSMGERTMLSDPINRLIQAYGYDPRTQAGLGDLASKYFDPVGLDAAKAGGYTTAQQIERGFGQALAGVPTDLGMSGLQHSGSSAIIGNRLNYERGLSDKNAIDQLLSGIGTANQNFTDFSTAQATARAAAREAVANRLAQQKGYHGESEETLPEDMDYSGGPGSVFQPAPDVQAVMDQGQQSGQWDSWVKAMGQQKLAPATQKAIKKAKTKVAPSPMWKALNMGKVGL